MKYFDEMFKDEDNVSFESSSKIMPIFVQWHNCLVEISVNTQEIADKLQLLYRSLLYSSMIVKNGQSPHPANHSVNYSLFYETGKYIITRAGKFAYSFDDLINTIPWFDWMLMTDIVDHNRHLAAVHAGALVKDDKTLVIAGSSGSGKSTLTMMMCLKGWKFVTDEVVVFSNNVISGVPRAFCLAETLAEKLFGQTVKFVKGIKRGKNYVYINPQQVNIASCGNNSGVTHLIFPKKNFNENKIKQIPLSKAMYLLTDNLFDICCHFKDKLDVLIDNVENVSTAELSWNDANSAVKEIEIFVGKNKFSDQAKLAQY